jgi:hypothetical protein
MHGLAIGDRVEVEADGEWWNAEVVGLTTEEVQIHFEGGGTLAPSWKDFPPCFPPGRKMISSAEGRRHASVARRPKPRCPFLASLLT